MPDTPNSGPPPSRCPHCGDALKLVGILPALAGLPKVSVFECPVCRTISRVTDPPTPPRQAPDKA